MPGVYRRESSLLIAEHVPKGQRSLGDLSRNKGADRGQFPPLSPSINTWPPIGTTLVLTLPNLLTPVPYSSLSPCAVFQSSLVSSQACLSPEIAGPLPQRASGPNLANTAGLLHCPTPPLPAYCRSAPSNMFLARAHQGRCHTPGSVQAAPHCLAPLQDDSCPGERGR